MTPGDHRRRKDAVYDQLARLTKALASPKRLELLDLLCQAPRTVEELAALAELGVANTSQHLKVLREAGLVAAQKRGLHVTYRRAGDDVDRLLVGLREVAAERVAELPRALRRVLGEDRPGASAHAIEAVDGPELVARVRRGEVVVLDVRPAEEFRAGHVPGARSIPLAELAARLRELPPDLPIVAYCRGPTCVYAADAARLLRERGYDARRMDLGVADWRSRGWSIDRGDEVSP